MTLDTPPPADRGQRRVHEQSCPGVFGRFVSNPDGPLENVVPVGLDFVGPRTTAAATVPGPWSVAIHRTSV